MESRQFPLPFPYVFLSEGSIASSTQVLWITIKKEVCSTLYAFLPSLMFLFRYCTVSCIPFTNFIIFYLVGRWE